MKKILLLFLSIFISSYAQDEILENYINVGINNNLALKQKQFSLEQSIADLDEARGMFFPTLDISARYSRAGGGRDIIFPVGDLFNPIYGTLNALSHSQIYPTDLGNEVIPFLRKKEHDTKISLVLPIIQPALFYNYSIKSNLFEIKEAEKNAYTRSLISEIKIAYYNYQKSREVAKLFSSTIELVTENLRVSKSLFKNDKVTVDVVHRAKAELSEVEQKQSDANRNVDLAASYFNFLLNKPLESKIKMFEDLTKYEIDDLSKLEALAIVNREEFSQLKTANKLAEKSKGLAQSNYYPGLVLAVDYGFQGEEYNFGKDDDYWMASLVLNWNLFNGFQDNAKVEKAELEANKISAQILEIKNRVKLQVREAYKNYIVAEKTIQSTKERLESYKNSFRIIDKKFNEGMASQIEYLDARNNLTQAEVLAVIAQYDYKQKYAELEKIVALVELNKYE